MFVLEGTDYQEVREALAEDLAAEGDGEGEVEGFLNPQPLPPRWSVLVSRWSTISFVNLRFFLGG